MDIIEHAREVFAIDRYATDVTGIVIEDCSVNHSVVSLKLDDRHRNAVGEVMGAVYYTLVDFSFAVASNYDRPMTVTLQSSITYMSSCRGNTLYAEADCTKIRRDAPKEIKLVGLRNIREIPKDFSFD